MGDDKPFACNAPGCEMRFTNEDHLTVHRKKHEMCLTLNVLENDNAKSSNISLFVDQTPTPTRFIRNCEEVGLFQDLQNMNPFEEHFRKATEATKAGHPPTHNSLRVTTPDNDMLNTPCILPSDLENDTNHNLQQDHRLSMANLSESDNSNGGSVDIVSRRRQVEGGGGGDAASNDDEDDARVGILLNMQEEAEEDEERKEYCHVSEPVTSSTNEDSTTSNSLMVASITPAGKRPISRTRGDAVSADDGLTVLTQSMMTPICSGSNNFGMGESSEMSILPTTESFGCDFISVPPYTKTAAQPSSLPNTVFSLASAMRTDYITVPPRAPTAPSLVSPVRKIATKQQVAAAAAPGVPAVSGSGNSGSTTTMLQLILRLPDGSSVPVNIPSLPVVSSVASTVATATPSQQHVVTAPVAQSRDQHVHTNNTAASFAKLKLRQSLAQSQTLAGSNGPGIKLFNERQVLAASDCLNLDSASNDSDSHDRSTFPSKRQRLEDDDEEKRKKFLERNRAAATRCRQKRKQWVQSLEGKADELSGVNQQLQNEVAMLRNEVAHLKSMLLAHKDCPVTQQQQKKMTHRNGSGVASSVIVANPEMLQLSAAEAIASSALTNLSQSTETSAIVAAPSAAPAVPSQHSPVILHTFMSREQAVALLNFSGSKNLAVRSGASNSATTAPGLTVEEALVQLDDDTG